MQVAPPLLQGRRILIVEDVFFIAADIRTVVREAGGVPVGPVATVEEAIQRVSEGRIDAAVLDVDLDGALSFVVADQLDQRDIPMLFATGYDEWAMPDAWRRRPRIEKPYATEALVAAIGDLLAAGHPDPAPPCPTPTGPARSGLAR